MTPEPLLPVMAQLSFAQERMWFLDQFEPGNVSNNCSTTIELARIVNVALLEQCLNEIVRRQEALRTCFVTRDGRPAQQIQRHLRVSIRDVDLSAVALVDDEVRELSIEESTRRFELDRLPLIRVTLFRLTPIRSVLQLTTHHIVWDAWSSSVLLQELLAHYEAYRRGEPSRVAPLAACYRDFARAERESVETPAARQDLAFWKRRLEDLAPVGLPTDYPRPPTRTFQGRCRTFDLSEDLGDAIEDLCAERGVTPFMLVLTALQVCLSFVSGDRRIAVGVPVANRVRPEWNPLIGFFVNLLVFRNEARADGSFTDFLDRVREDVLNAFAHAEYPFEQLVNEINPVRSSSVAPVFQVMLVYLNTAFPQLRLSGLTATFWNVESVTSKQDVTLTFSARDGRFLAAWEYDTTLFHPETIERFHAQFVRVLELLAEQRVPSPERLLDVQERARLQAWNATSREEWLHGTLAGLLTFAQPADRIAVVCDDRQMSYGALRAQVAAWSATLREAGVGPGTRVGILTTASVELIVGMLATLAAGAAYVPIDEGWPTYRIAETVKAADVTLVLTPPRARALPEEIPVRALQLQDRPDRDPRVAPTPVAPSEAAYAIFTSGSTGKPKGIEIPREAVWNVLQSVSRQLRVSADDVFVSVTTASFDIAVLEWALPLLAGGRTVLVPSDQARDPHELARAIAEHGPTVMQATPSLWSLMVDGVWPEHRRLRVLMTGGEPLTDDLARRLTRHASEVWNLYGPTETTIWSTAGLVTAGTPDLGAPIANTAVHLLTSRFDRVPVGAEGEICIAGAGLARGYLDQPGLTAARFVPDPLSAAPGGRMFRTGDVARWGADDRLRFVSRSDDQVKIRGFRVELEEIEHALRQHEGVQAAAAMVRADTAEHRRIVAYVVPSDRVMAADAAAETVSRALVSNWGTVFDEVFSRAASGGSDDPSFAGWNSSYTGGPLPTGEMLAWLEDAVRGIRRHEPRRILDVGCGAGLLLRSLAPQCDAYVGTDMSAAVLGIAARQLAGIEGARVRLLQRRADQFDGFHAGEFDTVVLNSVVQYFPSVEYLLDVLAQAAHVLDRGGRIVIGDVRNLWLLDALHTSIALEAAAASLPLGDVAPTVRSAVLQDNELVFAPEFFAAVAARLPRVRHVDIEPKIGPFENELKWFRYQVTLLVDSAEPAVAPPVWWDWSGDGLSSARLVEVLPDPSAPGVIGISGIPDRRLSVHTHAARLLRDLPPTARVEDLRRHLADRGAVPDPGLGPDAIRRIADVAGRVCDMSLARSMGEPVFDAILASRDAAPRAVRWSWPARVAAAGPIAKLASNPLRAHVSNRLIPELRSELGKRLPEYMVPDAFVVLPRLPLTPSGKLDRHALPPPRAAATDPHGAADAARSPIEQVVAQAWSDVLLVEDVAATDDFFALGGNSILVAQVCLVLTRVLGVQVPVRLLFECPVFERFVARVGALRSTGAAAAVLPSIEPDGRDFDPFPVTDIQEAYLLGRSSVFGLGDVSSHSYFEIESTRLDVDRFELAWRKLIDRHPMLRTVFSADGMQRVLPTVPAYEMRRFDARGMTDEDRERRLLAIRGEMSHAVHPPDRWPLFELRATRISDSLTRFHISIDALIVDAFSSTVLFREFRAFYLDPQAALPVQALTFRDYLRAVRAIEETDTFRRSEQYWLERLDDGFRGPDLPVLTADRKEAARFARRSFHLSKAQWHKIRSTALAKGLSPTMVALAAFGEVLAAWSRTQRFVLNLTLFNRLPLHPEVNRIVGDFTSVTLLEIQVNAGDTFETVAASTQRRLWSDLEHQFFSGVRVLRELRRRSGASQDIVAPVVFTSTLGIGADEEREDWGDEVFSISQTPQVWLDHKIFESRGGLGIDWDFADALFPAGVVDAMFDAYTGLLTALAEDEAIWEMPARALRRTLMRSVAEPAEAVAFDGCETLHGLFLDQAREHPHRLAVIARDRRLTYGDLDAWSAAYARQLLARGLGPEDIVAVVAPKGWQQSVAVLAVLRAGGAYLPIEPGEPEDRRLRMLRSSNAKFVLTTEALAVDLPWPDQCDRIVIEPVDVGDPEVAGPIAEAEVAGDRLAYVIYTSGSTGQPKGVMIEHRSAVNTLRDLMRRLDLGPHDRTLALSALSFDLSVFDCFGLWAVGGAVVYPEPSRGKDPSHWADLLVCEQVTIWNTVPALMELLVEIAPAARAPLRWVLLSGDWIPVSLPPKVRAKWPAARQMSLGGATEASIWSILRPIDEPVAGWTRIPYGRAMWNQSVEVVNEWLDPVPPWTVGHIVIGGIGLARGYLGDPALTADRFVLRPETGERLYRTGDLGRYLPDGEIEILGRSDEQTKLNGYRVEPAEIESVLEQQTGIQHAVVNVEQDSAGRKELVAYLVERPLEGSDAPASGETSAKLLTKLAQQAIRTFPSSTETIAFEDRAAGGELRRLLARQSYRYFTDAAGTLAHVSEWLRTAEARLASPARGAEGGTRSIGWLEQILRGLKQSRVPGVPLPKYHYPSAGSLYPVQSYVSIPRGTVEGIDDGAYYYDPRAHRLVRVGSCRSEAGTPPRLIFVAELRAIEHQYPEAALRFCALEAGYMRALVLGAVAGPAAARDALDLSDSQRVIAAYDLVADPAPAVVPMARLLMWARTGGLHGTAPGYYVRDPGHEFVRIGDAPADAAWFGPNRSLFERAHFAMASIAPDRSAEAYLDAGSTGQVMMAESTGFDLGLCPIGEIAEDFRTRAGVDGVITHGWVGGRIDPAQARTWMALPPRLDREELRERCRTRVARQLPSYMHPARYVFLDALPLNANHKVDRGMLRHAAALAGTPTRATDSSDRSPLEETIVAMLEQVLNRPISDVTEPFLATGASSMSILRFYGLLNDRYPDRVTFQDLFDNPSLREIARLVEGPLEPPPAAGAEILEF